MYATVGTSGAVDIALSVDGYKRASSTESVTSCGSGQVIPLATNRLTVLITVPFEILSAQAVCSAHTFISKR